MKKENLNCTERFTVIDHESMLWLVVNVNWTGLRDGEYFAVPRITIDMGKGETGAFHSMPISDRHLVMLKEFLDRYV
jgi:hypothetical protein